MNKTLLPGPVEPTSE